MEAELVSRAMAAATALAGALGLRVNDAVVIQNSNKLALRLLPCDVFARVAPLGQEVAALEVELARRLAAIASPVAALEPRVEPRVYERDGFAVTLWTYHEASPDQTRRPTTQTRSSVCTRGCEVSRSRRRTSRTESQRLNGWSRTERNPRALRGRSASPPDTLHSAGQQIHSRGAAEQLLHGEPHPGNLLSTQGGLLFIDLETCCRGPVEFDVAHVPDEVSAHYPDVDRVLLQECRRLVLAMVAAWRWDIRDEFPNGNQTRSRHPDLATRGSAVADTRCSALTHAAMGGVAGDLTCLVPMSPAGSGA